VGVLQAPNGWGKTSLMEAIAGLMPLAAGTIRLGGRSMEGVPVWERVKDGLSFLQSRNNTFQNLTVEETFRLCGVNLVPEAMQGLLAKRVANLSGGERQRVVLACHQAKSAIVQLLDEPFSALDGVGLKYAEELMQVGPDRACLVTVPAVVLEGDL
jgi:branched-chain amino acid transport system ATP-binding protein